jgi:hypothetical protein
VFTQRVGKMPDQPNSQHLRRAWLAQPVLHVKGAQPAMPNLPFP